MNPQWNIMSLEWAGQTHGVHSITGSVRDSGRRRRTTRCSGPWRSVPCEGASFATNDSKTSNLKSAEFVKKFEKKTVRWSQHSDLSDPHAWKKKNSKLQSPNVPKQLHVTSVKCKFLAKAQCVGSRLSIYMANNPPFQNLLFTDTGVLSNWRFLQDTHDWQDLLRVAIVNISCIQRTSFCTTHSSLMICQLWKLAGEYKPIFFHLTASSSNLSQFCDFTRAFQGGKNPNIDPTRCLDNSDLRPGDPRRCRSPLMGLIQC